MLADSSTRHVRVDLGPRIELVTADRYFHNASMALYRVVDRVASALVHSYSGRPGVTERSAWLARAAATLGGFVAETGTPTVTIPCATWHERAIRRIFLDAAKLDPAADPLPMSLATRDTRRGFDVSVEPLGSGRYRVRTAEGAPSSADPARSVAAGLAKLAEVALDPEDDTIVVFPCEADHDHLVAALLPRAINIRATLREQALDASRGLLLAPSAQSQEAET